MTLPKTIEQRLQEKVCNVFGNMYVPETDVREILQEALEEKESGIRKAFEAQKKHCSEMIELRNKKNDFDGAALWMVKEQYTDGLMKIFLSGEALGAEEKNYQTEEALAFDRSWEKAKSEITEAEEKKEKCRYCSKDLKPHENGVYGMCKDCWHEGEEEPVPEGGVQAYLNMTDEQKGEIVRKAIQISNQEQKEFMDKYRGENWREELGLQANEVPFGFTKKQWAGVEKYCEENCIKEHGIKFPEIEKLLYEATNHAAKCAKNAMQKDLKDYETGNYYFEFEKMVESLLASQALRHEKEVASERKKLEDAMITKELEVISAYNKGRENALSDMQVKTSTDLS